MSDKVFLDIINMSITGSFAILIIILARLLLKKAPKVFSYALWFVAFFRLLVPVSFESVLSILPFNTTPLSTDMLYIETPYVETGVKAVAQAASHREGGGNPVRNFQHHIFGHIGVIPFQVDNGHSYVLHFKIVGWSRLKWRTGGPRHLGASGHRDQKRGGGYIKAPAQHKAIRAHENTFSLIDCHISHP